MFEKIYGIKYICILHTYNTCFGAVVIVGVGQGGTTGTSLLLIRHLDLLKIINVNLLFFYIKLN